MKYKIYHLIDPRKPKDIRYVGFTSHPLKVRLQRHLEPSNMRKPGHKNRWLSKLVREGVKPIITLVCTTDKDGWATAEKVEIARLKPIGLLTNSTDGGEGCLNPSPETRAKRSKSLKISRGTPDARAAAAAMSRGRIVSAETRARISAAQKGKKVSLEARANMRDGQLGRKQTTEHIAASAAARTGMRRSAESIAKTAAANTGKKRSPEFCARILSINTGRKQSAETIEKRAMANTGKKRTLEQRERMSIAATGKKPITAETRAKMRLAHLGAKLSPESIAKRTKTLAERRCHKWGAV